MNHAMYQQLTSDVMAITIVAAIIIITLAVGR